MTWCFEWIYCFELISIQIKLDWKNRLKLIIWIFYDESNRHNGGATSYPSHSHIAWCKIFTTFSILHGVCTVIKVHNFVTLLGIDYDKKWASQISDNRVIVIRFMMTKYIFVAEDLLWHGIGDEPIFVTQLSQIMKDDKNITFNDINEISQKPICVVVWKDKGSFQGLGASG